MDAVRLGLPSRMGSHHLDRAKEIAVDEELHLAVAARVDLGFDRVIREENPTKLRLARAVDALASTLGSADVGLLYYAGQVVEVEGENYLLCADSAATSRAASATVMDAP